MRTRSLHTRLCSIKDVHDHRNRNTHMKCQINFSSICLNIWALKGYICCIICYCANNVFILKIIFEFYSFLLFFIYIFIWKKKYTQTFSLKFSLSPTHTRSPTIKIYDERTERTILEIKLSGLDFICACFCDCVSNFEQFYRIEWMHFEFIHNHSLCSYWFKCMLSMLSPHENRVQREGEREKKRAIALKRIQSLSRKTDWVLTMSVEKKLEVFIVFFIYSIYMVYT